MYSSLLSYYLRLDRAFNAPSRVVANIQKYNGGLPDLGDTQILIHLSIKYGLNGLIQVNNFRPMRITYGEPDDDYYFIHLQTNSKDGNDGNVGHFTCYDYDDGVSGVGVSKSIKGCQEQKPLNEVQKQGRGEVGKLEVTFDECAAVLRAMISSYGGVVDYRVLIHDYRENTGIDLSYTMYGFVNARDFWQACAIGVDGVNLTIPTNHIMEMVQRQKGGVKQLPPGQRSICDRESIFNDNLPLPLLPNGGTGFSSEESLWSDDMSSGYDTVCKTLSGRSSPERPKTSRDLIPKLLSLLEREEVKCRPDDNGFNFRIVDGKPYVYKRDVDCEVSGYGCDSSVKSSYLMNQCDVNCDKDDDVVMQQFLKDVVKFGGRRKIPLNIMERFYNYVCRVVNRRKANKVVRPVTRPVVLPPLVNDYPDKDVIRKVKVGDSIEDVKVPHKRTLPPMFNFSYPLAYRSVDEERQSDLPIKVPNLGFVGNIGSVDLDIYNEISVLLLGKKRTMQTPTFIVTMIRNVIRGYDMRLYTPENYKTMITATTYALMIIDSGEMLCMDKLRDRRILKNVAKHNKILLEGISNRRWYHSFPIIKSLVSKPHSIPGQRI